MARSKLQDSSGNDVIVDEGEVAKASVTFTDYDNASLATASLLSLVMTLRNAEDGSVVNSRSDTNILNTGNGTVSDSGGAAVLSLILDEDDNATQGTRWLDLKWTWNDGVGVRTGKGAFWYPVADLDVPNSGVGWIG